MDKFMEIAPDFYIRSDFAEGLKKLGFKTIDDVFAFAGGKNLAKKNLAAFRQRISFETDNPETTLFLKRYQNIPVSKQIKNWFSRRGRISMADCDRAPAETLKNLGINTPRTVAFGTQWQGIFEKRSFIITEKIPASHSLEEKLPDSFYNDRKNFIEQFAAFIRKFHNTGFCHRDLYLCHIFCNTGGNFTIIDLSRVFKPLVFSKRFLVKDLAQLYYSSPGSIVTKADRLRFYLFYMYKDRISLRDKIIIKKIKSKAQQMAKHDRKHNRIPPFEN
ncbi:MAG: lipopolysaccharide kinase InaA family protein [Phycisphaerae bacterium]|nr:lipopolysaccharide kinase InaA family protein [Phycisphaerae bacterium]